MTQHNVEVVKINNHDNRRMKEELLWNSETLSHQGFLQEILISSFFTTILHSLLKHIPQELLWRHRRWERHHFCIYLRFFCCLNEVFITTCFEVEVDVSWIWRTECFTRNTEYSARREKSYTPRRNISKRKTASTQYKTFDYKLWTSMTYLTSTTIFSKNHVVNKVSSHHFY